ncbi:MAG: hypothetical protein ABL940_08275 [Bacteroidia bacterium]
MLGEVIKQKHFSELSFEIHKEIEGDWLAINQCRDFSAVEMDNLPQLIEALQGILKSYTDEKDN